MPPENQHWTSDSDLLDRYVLNKLELEERAKLDAHVRECEECARVVRAEQELVAGIRQFGREELKARLKERLNKEERQEIPWFKIAGLAATIIVLVSIGLYNKWFVPQEHDLIIEQSPQAASKAGETPQESKEEQSPALAERQLESRSKSQHDMAGGVGSKQSQFEQQRPVLRARRDSIAMVPEGPGYALVPSAQSQSITASEAKETVAISKSQKPVQTLTIHAERVHEGLWVDGVVLTDKRDELKGLMSKGIPTERSEPQTARKMQTLADSHEKQVIRFGTESQTIVLHQRPIVDLPQSQQQRQTSPQHVPTFIEKANNEFRMTLYLDRTVKNEVLQSAKIEQVTQDSVILHLPGQKIGYKIPRGWGKK